MWKIIPIAAILALVATAETLPAQPAGCPPGLAKKSPACIPPGQAKKYGIGDRIDRDYRVLRNPGRWGLDPDETYYRVGDYLYRVDRETREVLDLIGAIAAVLD